MIEKLCMLVGTGRSSETVAYVLLGYAFKTVNT